MSLFSQLGYFTDDGISAAINVRDPYSDSVVSICCFCSIVIAVNCIRAFGILISNSSPGLDFQYSKLDSSFSFLFFQLCTDKLANVE
jgi:hypothetical protein